MEIIILSLHTNKFEIGVYFVFFHAIRAMARCYGI